MLRWIVCVLKGFLEVFSGKFHHGDTFLTEYPGTCPKHPAGVWTHPDPVTGGTRPGKPAGYPDGKLADSTHATDTRVSLRRTHACQDVESRGGTKQRLVQPVAGNSQCMFSHFNGTCVCSSYETVILTRRYVAHPVSLPIVRTREVPGMWRQTTRHSVALKAIADKRAVVLSMNVRNNDFGNVVCDEGDITSKRLAKACVKLNVLSMV